MSMSRIFLEGHRHHSQLHPPHHSERLPFPRHEKLDFTLVLTSPEGRSLVEQFVASKNLTVTEACDYYVRVEGTAEDACRAFGVGFYTTADAPEIRHYERQPSLPMDVHIHVQCILNLTTAPVACPQVKRKPGTTQYSGKFPHDSYGPSQLSAAYHLPSADGEGQAVGIIELGGATSLIDMNEWFQALGYQGAPNVVSVSVDGAKNEHGMCDADCQCALDVDVITGLVPKATVVMFFAPNTAQGFYHAILKAIDDPRQLAALCIGWGCPEIGTLDNAIKNAFNAAFCRASSLGMVVTVAAGNNGASDRPSADGGVVDDGQVFVQFPASSPYVLAVGGTQWTRKESQQQFSEVVWNEISKKCGASGGGVSEFFRAPEYQTKCISDSLPKGLSNPDFVGRIVPDVTALASPEHGYQVFYQGHPTCMGGTAGGAALWAAIFVKFAQILGGRHNLRGYHEMMYENREKVFRQIKEGDNKCPSGLGYCATPGFNAASGLGAPNGNKLLEVFQQHNSA